MPKLATVCIEPTRGPVVPIEPRKVFVFHLKAGGQITVHARDIIEAVRTARPFGLNPHEVRRIAMPSDHNH